ncbi:MAG: sulfoxide reductase heme-binding subunit YedZ [Anaerolineales bacterium]|nr:sulfoxide reductase heme-binding subunit YedZ [Anaerolineales bacterium]
MNTITIFGRKFTWLEVIIHLGAWIPLLLISIKFFNGGLTVNPIQDIEQRTGRLAILWLVLSLSCTPLGNIFGWKEMIKRRRTIGLYAFIMAFIHVSIFIALDFGFAIDLIIAEILEKRFILLGALAFNGLTLLAVTSFKYWQKKLKKNWKRLHRTIYVIAPIVVIHYGLAKKGNLLSLQGDIIRPVIYAVIVTLLLVMRIRPVRQWLKNFWDRLTTKVANWRKSQSPA